jgi:hypothetical protein
MLGRSRLNGCAFAKIITTIYLEILTCSPCIAHSQRLTPVLQPSRIRSSPTVLASLSNQSLFDDEMAVKWVGRQGEFFGGRKSYSIQF